MALLYMFRVTISPIIRSTMLYIQQDAKIAFFIRNGFTLHVSGDNLTHHQEYNAVYNKMQQLRFLFAMALLYMFQVTISPIIRSTMLYITRCNNCVFYSQWLYSTCFW